MADLTPPHRSGDIDPLVREAERLEREARSATTDAAALEKQRRSFRKSADNLGSILRRLEQQGYGRNESSTNRAIGHHTSNMRREIDALRRAGADIERELDRYERLRGRVPDTSLMPAIGRETRAAAAPAVRVSGDRGVDLATYQRALDSLPPWMRGVAPVDVVRQMPTNVDPATSAAWKAGNVRGAYLGGRHRVIMPAEGPQAAPKRNQAQIASTMAHEFWHGRTADDIEGMGTRAQARMAQQLEAMSERIRRELLTRARESMVNGADRLKLTPGELAGLEIPKAVAAHASGDAPGLGMSRASAMIHEGGARIAQFAVEDPDRFAQIVGQENARAFENVMRGAGIRNAGFSAESIPERSPAQQRRDADVDRDFARKQAANAVEARKEAERAFNQAEGKVKSAQTRLRKLDEGALPVAPDRYQRAQASVAAASAKRDEARAELDRRTEEVRKRTQAAKEANDRRRALRDELRAAPAPQPPVNEDLEAEKRRLREKPVDVTGAMTRSGEQLGKTSQEADEALRKVRELEKLTEPAKPADNEEARRAEAEQAAAERQRRARDNEARAAEDTSKRKTRAKRQEADATRAAGTADRQAGQASGGEEAAAAATERKAAAASKAAAALRRQNEQLIAAGPAAEGEITAAAAVERKAVAAERAAAALAAQNREMRAAGRVPVQTTANPSDRAPVGSTDTTPSASMVATAQRQRNARSTAATIDAESRAAQQAALENKALANAQRESAAMQRMSTQAMNQGIAAYAGMSSAMTRHGVWTTEAIQAAREGTLTYREWGEQITGTAAKFAGWTAVSIPIFAAMDAARQVGTGAVAGASGVNELSRFINDLDASQAQQDMRDLSREFNLPIEDVVTAYAGMGRVFNQQEPALEAARSALLAMRVAGLDAAESVRYLGAITQGFNVPAEGLTTVIDQLNEAQNTLNFNLDTGIAGISRAAGSWRAAGGTFSDLLALMVTAQRSTGATGEVIGTALRRSAEFTGREGNQARLRGYGIDPTQGIDQTYRQAFALVESGQVRGQEIIRLATALSSPQLAATIAPMLANFELYREALVKTNEEAAKGSARNELAIMLDAIRERIARVGTELQQLGSNLAQGGFLLPLQAMVVFLSEGLQLVNTLLGAFNELPGPVRQLLATWIQLYGVMRLARRVDFGGRFPEGSLAQRAFSDNPQRLNNRLALRDFRELERELAAETEAASRRQSRAGVGLFAAQQNLDANMSRVLPGEDETATRRRRFAALSRWQQAEDTYMRAANEAEGLREETRRARENTARAADAIKRGQNISDLAGASMVYGRPTMGYETAEEPRPHAPVGVAFGGGRPGDRTHLDVRSAADLVERAATTDALADAAAATNTSTEALEGNQRQRRTLGQTLSREGRTALANRRVAINVRQTATRAGNALSSLASSLAGAGRSLVGMFGPLDLVLLGLIAIPSIYNARKQQIEKANEAIRDAGTRPANVDERNERVARAEAEEARQEEGLSGFEERQRFRESEEDRVRRETDRALLTERRTRLTQRRRGLPETGLFLSEIRERINDDMRDLESGVIQGSELGEWYARRLKEIQGSAEGTAGNSKAVENEIAAFRARVRGFFSDDQFTTQIRNAGVTENANIIGEQGAYIEAFGVTDERLNRAGRAYSNAVQRVRGSRDAETLKVFFEARKALTDAIAQNADRLQGALTAAGGDYEARQDAYRRYASSAAEPLRGAQRERDNARTNLESAGQARRRAQERVRRREAELRRARRETPDAMYDFGPLVEGGITSPVDGAENNLAEAKRQAAAAEKAYRNAAAKDKAAARGLSDARRVVREAQREVLQAMIDERNQVTQAETRLSNANTRNEGQRIANRLRDIRTRLSRALYLNAQGVNNIADVINLRAERDEATLEQQDEALARLRSRGALEASRLPEDQQGAATLSSLQEQYALAVSQGRDQKELDDLQAQINNQRRQNAEEAASRARENLTSLYDLRIARVEDDPVKAAQLEAERDQRLVGLAKTPAERRTAQATAIRSNRGLRDARLQSQLDDLQFDNDMGRLSDQAYARSLQHIAATVNMPKDMRRRLLVQARQLLEQDNSENELDLDLGNIRLPTMYEMRRLVAGRSESVTTVNRNQVSIQVNPGTDMDELGRRLEAALGTGVRGAVRAGGRR